MRRGSQAAVQGALERTRSPYVSYDGKRIADLSENERRGMAAARRGYGAFAKDYDRARGSVRDVDFKDFSRSRRSLGEVGFGDFDTARGYVGDVGSVADRGALEGYINPYLDEVLSPQLRRRNEAFEQARAEMERTAGMRGAFGGRQDIAEASLREGHQQGLDDLYGMAYAGAFDRATDLFGSEQDRKLRQAGAFTDIGTREAGLRMQRAGQYADIGSREGGLKLRKAGAFADIAGRESADNRAALRDLMSTGMVGRRRDQAELDFKYLKHLEERDWDINNIGTLANVLATVPHGSTQTGTSRGTQTTTREKSSSPLKTIAGVGAIAAGAIMTGGGSVLGKALIGAGTSAFG